MVESRAGGGVLDGQLEGDVHLGLFSQRHDFRKLHHLREDTRFMSTLLRRHDDSSVIWLQGEWGVDCPLLAVWSTAPCF